MTSHGTQSEEQWQQGYKNQHGSAHDNINNIDKKPTKAKRGKQT